MTYVDATYSFTPRRMPRYSSPSGRRLATGILVIPRSAVTEQPQTCSAPPRFAMLKAS